MAGELIIPVVGNISEFEMKFLPDGTPVGRFAVASTPRVFKENEWRDGETSWVNVTVWRKLAENCAETLTKGMRVIVLGKFAARTYETKEGEKRTVWEMTADAVGPELTFATAKVAKVGRVGGGDSASREDPFEAASHTRPAAASGTGAAKAPPQSATPPSDDW